MGLEKPTSPGGTLKIGRDAILEKSSAVPAGLNLEILYSHLVKAQILFGLSGPTKVVP
jgi:hypothetical protein